MGAQSRITDYSFRSLGVFQGLQIPVLGMVLTLFPGDYAGKGSGFQRCHSEQSFWRLMSGHRCCSYQGAALHELNWRR